MTPTVAFHLDAASPGAPWRHPWQWCVGSDHATMALRADWQEQLRRARRELGFRHVRFHGILDDDMGTLVCQMERPVYSFLNADRIMDFLRSIDMRPVVELSFMPRMLSSGNDIVFHYQGNVTPPRDMGAWAELVRRLAAHWVDRYGLDEVAQWPFEVWNEPNLKAFWTGDQAAYFALYRATAEALKSVSPRLQVAGPVTAGNAWLPEFLAFCGDTVPVDMVTTHYYPTDAFGEVGADTVTQLEHAPPGIMRTRAIEARDAVQAWAAAHGRTAPPLAYTEWNISSNPRDAQHDESFAAAFAARILLDVDDVVDGYAWWTFSDLFEENWFPSTPFHGGFGLLTLHGVPKPLYRAFQLVHRLRGARLAVDGSHATAQAWGAMGDDGVVRVLLVNHAAPRHPIATECASVRVARPAGWGTARARWTRIDAEHAAPKAAWLAMGSPEYPTPSQVDALEAASQAVPEPVPCRVEDGAAVVDLALAPQSVHLLEIDPS